MEGTLTQLGLKNYLFSEKQPQKSFFQHSYKNFYNFAKDTRKLDFRSNLNFGKRASFRLDADGRYGDLVSNLMLQVELPDVSSLTTSTGSKVGYTNGVGNALIKEVQLKIGGNVVDTQTGEWLDVWSSLAITKGKLDIYHDMVKKFPGQYVSNFKGGTVFIPLFFWFCQNVNANTKDNKALTLPLIGMRNCEIEIIIQFKSASELLIYEDTSSLSSSQLSSLSITQNYMLVDYITLQTEERIKYLEAKKQMYLITQTQSQTFQFDAGQSNINLNLRQFKYPITELIWVLRSNTNKDNNHYFNYTDSLINDPNRKGFLATGKLVFDGRDRLPEMTADYFTKVEPFKLHENVPDKNTINCVSFSLEPENFAQPSGSCNFSYLHEPRFQLTTKAGLPAGELILFAINYNVLQMDNKGNVWLLHNLSKSAPDALPNLNRPRSIEECKLAVEETRKAKQLISTINTINQFVKPQDIEPEVANIIQSALFNKKSNKNDTHEVQIKEVINPLLDSLNQEMDKVSTKVNELIDNGQSIQDLMIKGIEIAGKRVPIDKITDYLAHLGKEFIENNII